MASPQNTSKKSNVGPIVGGVIGGLIGLGLLVFLAIFCWRRSRQNSDDNIEKAANGPDDLIPAAFPYESPSQRRTEGAVPELGNRPPQESDTLSPLRYYPPTKGRRDAALAISHDTSSSSRHTPPTSSNSAYTSSSHGTSSVVPPSTTPSSRSRTTTTPVSPSEVQGLRAEVENLRLVMQSFQPDRYDPPPEYIGS
jgi:hypothetical protein